MRPSLPLAVALLAATAVPSSAGILPAACHATADQPTAQHSFGTNATGSFTCDTARASLSVEVCLEWLNGAKWTAVDCQPNTVADASEVSATAYGCEWGLYLYRTTTRGTSSDGESDTATSLPVAYFCTPLASS